MTEKYLNPTNEAGRDFIMRQIPGTVFMLNLLRFREYADYTETPDLAPPSPITGEAAYRLYIDHTLPFLTGSGGEMVFFGIGGNFLIGPANERWDAVMLIRQQSVSSFLDFAANQEYIKGTGHRTAALADSRLLPVTENPLF